MEWNPNNLLTKRAILANLFADDILKHAYILAALSDLWYPVEIISLAQFNKYRVYEFDLLTQWRSNWIKHLENRWTRVAIGYQFYGHWSDQDLRNWNCNGEFMVIYWKYVWSSFITERGVWKGFRMIFLNRRWGCDISISERGLSVDC